MRAQSNIIFVTSDTLRADYLGCYGNQSIRTPNIDAFADESVVFNHTYPEALPTIPVRRASYTGRRVYPFNNYKPLKWDNVYLPGWQPLDNDEDSLAENLVKVGYYTGFVSDIPHYFVPGMNFTRGFWQWEFVRGQSGDKWGSPAVASDEKLSKYGNPEELKRLFPQGRALRHVANYAHICSEEETTTAKIFRWAMNFIEDNRNIQPFYLVIDCFDPHESWEAPKSYLDMYADPNYKGRTILHPKYGSATGIYTTEEIKHMKAHYCGLVSLVDTWFGYFLDKLKRIGLFENSLIVFTSDHGTSFADNPEGIIGKPHYCLYPEVMHIPLIIHFPGSVKAGIRFNNLIYNIDITATIYEHAKLNINELDIHGQSLKSLIYGGRWNDRGYVTSRYGNTVWYRDHKYWAIIDISGKPRAVFNVQQDPDCKNNISSEADEIINKAWSRILQDAGGELPAYEINKIRNVLGHAGVGWM